MPARHPAIRRSGVRLAATTVAAGPFPRPPGPRHTERMRPASVFFAILGGCALVASVALEVAMNSPANVVWGFIGPGVFYAAGLAGVGLGQGRVRGPGRPVAAWLLAVGALFMVDVCLGDALYD